MSASIARLLWCALALTLACHGLPAPAAQERYDYDALGRLIRVIDDQGRVTEYVYDAAGNILQVTGAGAGSAQAPVIATIAPATVRRNRARTFQVSGSGLQGVRVSASDPALDISNVAVTPTSISFTLAVTGTAALGSHTISFTNAAGAAQGTITVAPAVDYVLTPNPLALPPDNVARQFYLFASEADTESITLTASTLNPAIARTGTVPITLAAGQSQTTGTITGIAVGTTQVRLSSPGFVEPVFATVYVTTDTANVNVFHSRVLGVVKGDPSRPSTNTIYGPVMTPSLGVIKGDPTSAPSNPALGPVVTAPLGVIKGDATGADTNPVLGPLSTPPLGVIKGDPTSPSAGGNAGPVMAPILGVEKQ